MRLVKFLAVITIIFAVPFLSFAGEKTVNLPKLIVFFSPSCHKCMQVKAEVLPGIEKEFKGRVAIEYRDITDIDNYTFMIGLKERFNPDIEFEVPVFFYEGKFLNGKGDVNKNLHAVITQSLASPVKGIDVSSVDLVERFKSFKPIAIVAAGLEDGINPCAFTVIVFFISFLSLQGYRKKEIALIGLSFISAVFLTYFLIGIGIFNFLYTLKGFWVFTRAFNMLVGILSVALGLFALYDFFKFKKTKDTEGLILQLPKSVKYQINKVIGLHYRRPKEQGPAEKPHIIRLILSAFVTGFLVCLLEAVCTGQLYLPTITFVFKTTPLKLHALGYLFLYNILFVAPLLIIFFFALMGVTSEQFSRFLKRNLGAIKISMAVIFFSLGAYLIWRG